MQPVIFIHQIHQYFNSAYTSIHTHIPLNFKAICKLDRHMEYLAVETAT